MCAILLQPWINELGQKKYSNKQLTNKTDSFHAKTETESTGKSSLTIGVHAVSVIVSVLSSQKMHIISVYVSYIECPFMLISNYLKT